MKSLSTTLVVLLLLIGAEQSYADDKTIYQDCLLEGKVVAEQGAGGKNIIHIDFYKAEPYKSGTRCIINGALKFKQPKGSLIENLSEGSVVQYHYIKTNKGETSWQLVGAFI